jgi:cell division initiation protein
LEISPLDVRNQVFGKKMRGYDPDEVKQFLDSIADRMEGMLKAKDEMERENASLRDMVGAYAKMEQNLRDTLLTAQKVSADARSAADQTAHNVIREAELEAQKQIASAASQVEAIARTREMLKAETVALAARVKSLLEAQARFIDSIVEEAEKEGSQATRAT